MSPILINLYVTCMGGRLVVVVGTPLMSPILDLLELVVDPRGSLKDTTGMSPTYSRSPLYSGIRW